jgi:hypothetical protein
MTWANDYKIFQCLDLKVGRRGISYASVWLFLMKPPLTIPQTFWRLEPNAIFGPTSPLKDPLTTFFDIGKKREKNTLCGLQVIISKGMPAYTRTHICCVSDEPWNNANAASSGRCNQY